MTIENSIKQSILKKIFSYNDFFAEYFQYNKMLNHFIDKDQKEFYIDISREIIIYDYGVEISFNDFLEQNNLLLEYQQFMIKIL